MTHQLKSRTRQIYKKKKFVNNNYNHQNIETKEKTNKQTNQKRCNQMEENKSREEG